MVYRALYSYRQRVRVVTLFPKLFFVFFLFVERFCKRFWKESLMRTSSSFAWCSACTFKSELVFSIVNKSWQRFLSYLWSWMWVSVALVKFHWFGIKWHVFNQSECRNCCLYVVIQKIAPQAKSGKYFQIWFFPRFGGKNGVVLSMRMQVILDSFSSPEPLFLLVTWLAKRRALEAPITGCQ